VLPARPVPFTSQICPQVRVIERGSLPKAAHLRAIDLLHCRLIEPIAPRLLPTHWLLCDEETRLCANYSACFLHRPCSQQLFVATRKRGIIAAMDVTAICGVAATLITVRTRAVAPGTMSVCMSTNASPTVLPKYEPQLRRFL
jgi:hypothetical protein